MRRAHPRNSPDLDIINLYRPPIRQDETDKRTDKFNPDFLPHGDNVIVTGPFNAHHPLWNSDCDQADEVGERVATWLDTRRWTVLNVGTPTFASYRSGSLTAPDVACCSSVLSQRCSWRTGPDIGNDHLPMLMEVRTSSAPPQTDP